MGSTPSTRRREHDINRTTITDLASLRARCAGALVTPEDTGFAEACRSLGLGDGGRPAAIGFPADAEDVACMESGAREAGLEIVALVLRYPTG